MISTRMHGILDYVIGFLLIIAPWVLGFAEYDAARNVPLILGLGLIAYSLFTDYELSVAKVIPMKTHLLIDVLAGLFLLASPWIFNFDEVVRWPHVIVGLLEIGTAAMTHRQPSHRHEGYGTPAYR